jgi:hypothetical protein
VASIPEVRVLGYALLLHFLWEWLQSPFYADTYEAVFLSLLWNRVHCTLGDGLITLGAFWGAATVGESRGWYRDPRPLALAVFLGGGLLYTAWSEYWNVQIVRTWDYTSLMPTLWGVGVVPLAQWIVLPLLVLWLVRRGDRGEWRKVACR